MWADVPTKPLQGVEFKKMSAFLMNCPVEYEEDEHGETSTAIGMLIGRGTRTIPFQTSQECVRRIGHTQLAGRQTSDKENPE